MLKFFYLMGIFYVMGKLSCKWTGLDIHFKSTLHIILLKTLHHTAELFISTVIKKMALHNFGQDLLSIR